MTATTEKVVEKAKQDSLGRYYATGKRKESVARVWISLGKGEISINDKKMPEYFERDVLQMIVNQPFALVDKLGKFNLKATVQGGGKSGQAQAIRHGISKALLLFDETLRSTLKKEGLVTRDARRVERKKPGQPKARKSFQFSKR
ncbi:MAG: 30S ribosomal protein S9 [Alphaproteobacteria bacterium]|nr:30S ribosomal protein S9 [Alphaproteobacteria bacterium]